jgi:CspA family cold shock protein
MAEGKVRWFDEKKGYGFIGRENERDVFVHYSAIQAKGFRTLVDDEPVSFDIVQSPRVHAENVVRLNIVDGNVKS